MVILILMLFGSLLVLTGISEYDDYHRRGNYAGKFTPGGLIFLGILIFIGAMILGK